MARLTKELLKKMLKECLMEIAEEERLLIAKETKEVSKSSIKEHVAKRHPLTKDELIQKHFSSEQEDEDEDDIISNPHLKETINNLSNNLGVLDESKKAIFESIFEDTARTTYVEMMQNDINYRGPAPKPTKEQKQADEQSLKSLAPEGDVSRWAKWAFGDKN